MLVFAYLWITLLIAPIVAYILTKAYYDNKKYLRTILSLTGLLILLFVLELNQIYLNIDNISIMLFCVGYFLYSSLICLLLVRKKYLFFYFGIIPIFLGYFLGTFGLLGLGFISNDFDIEAKVWLSENIYFEKKSFGNATTSYGGYCYSVYETYKLSPFKKEIVSCSIDDNDNDTPKLFYYNSNGVPLVISVSCSKVEIKNTN